MAKGIPRSEKVGVLYDIGRCDDTGPANVALDAPMPGEVEGIVNGQYLCLIGARVSVRNRPAGINLRDT